MGKQIRLTAADGHALDAYEARPEGTPKGGLVVIQEIFGVNSHIRAVVDGFAADGYHAIAPALFDRTEKGVDLGYRPEDIQQGLDLRAKIAPEDAVADVAAAIDALKGEGKLGVVGYCWGGTLAYLAACRLEGLGCAVGYYGGQIGAFLDESPNIPTMLHFGDKDTSIPMETVEKIRAAKPGLTYHIYGAGHGFNCDQRGSYDAASAKLARERTLAFFAEHMG